MVRSANWRDDAACIDADPDLFFPVDATGPVLDQADIAKRICLGCPVQKRCLTLAMDLGFVFGIWGGTTESKRSNIRRAATRQRRRAEKAARTHDKPEDSRAFRQPAVAGSPIAKNSDMTP